MSEASVMGLVMAGVFGTAAVVPYFVAALRLLRTGGARQPRRSPQ